MAGPLRRWLAGRSMVDTALEARLRLTRFRHLLGCHAELVRLAEDATEKQGGAFVLDRQYVLGVAERALELAEAAVFDLNALTGERHLELYAQLRRTAEAVEHALEGSAGGRDADRPAATPPSDRVRLAAAIAAAPLLFEDQGQVACRGVAAGPVYNLEVEGGLPPPGAVVVGREIHSGQAMLGVIGAAAAVLLERGSPASELASLAREARVPMLVGVAEVSERLVSGRAVTVDADELRVYGGRVEELVEYSRALQSDAEEPEYALLRAVRRAAFPRTPGAEPSAASPCATLNDVVEVARELGTVATGEAVRAAAAAAPPGRAGARIVELAPGGSSAPVVAGFLAGASGRLAPVEVSVAAAPERACAVCSGAAGLDVVYAELCPGGGGGGLYARFAARLAAAEVSVLRGRAAAVGLRRLGFAPLEGAAAVAGWADGLSAAAFEDRLRGLGRVAACLAALDADPASGALGLDELLGGAL